MFIYRSRFLTRGEVWFEGSPAPSRVDWILYRHQDKPVPRARWRHFHNLVIDLRKSVEQLRAELDPRTASKIQAAEKDEGVRCAWSPVAEETQLNELEHWWNHSIESRRRWGPLSRAWLRPMIAAGALELSSARSPAGAPLALGGLFRGARRAQQLMIVSPPREAPDPASRARTARACACLIWHTLLRLKREGVDCFDFGGWYPGSADIQLLGANAFKRGFGGAVVREFECEQTITLRGRVALTAARWVERFKEARSPNREIWKGQTDATPAR